MSDKSKIKVIETRERPEELKGYCMVVCGIRTREAAEQWGAKYGFTLVYWIKAQEKVYGVNPIDEQAETLKQQSVQLLNSLEQNT